MTQSKPIHILLADDDDDDTSLFQEALGQIPVPTKLNIAENGMELMLTLQDNQSVPDLIFLDMNMPFKNGLECLHEIRSSDDFSHVPVVILSTSVADYLLESAFQAGANLYIQKPNSFSGLVDILSKCLRQDQKLDRAATLEQFLIKNNAN
jgi:CheY-like chemotaxis protein